MADQKDEGFKGLGLGAHTGTTDGATQGKVTSARGLGITNTGTTGEEPIQRDMENGRGGRGGMVSTSSNSRSGADINAIGIAGTNSIGIAPEELVEEADREAREGDEFGEEAGSRSPSRAGVANPPELGGGMGGTSDSETAAEDAWSDVETPRPDDKISRGGRAA